MGTRKWLLASRALRYADDVPGVAGCRASGLSASPDRYGVDQPGAETRRLPGLDLARRCVDRFGRARGRLVRVHAEYMVCTRRHSWTTVVHGERTALGRFQAGWFRWPSIRMRSAMNDRLAGILLGTAVGDALGLPAEGLSPRRRRRLMPGPWRHRLLFGRGMVSDDTEHTLFVAQSLLRYPTDADAFQRRLAWRLRWWFAGLPAGVGMATARACVKLWLGSRPVEAGYSLPATALPCGAPSSAATSMTSRNCCGVLCWPQRKLPIPTPRR